jgi:hypothetical protein
VEGTGPRRIDLGGLSPRKSEIVNNAPVSPRVLDEERLQRERAEELKRIEEVKNKAQALRRRLELKKQAGENANAGSAENHLNSNDLPSPSSQIPEIRTESTTTTNSQQLPPQQQQQQVEQQGEEVPLDENDELHILLNNAISAQQASQRYTQFLSDLRAAFSNVLQMVISFEQNYLQVDLLREIGVISFCDLFLSLYYLLFIELSIMISSVFSCVTLFPSWMILNH